MGQCRFSERAVLAQRHTVQSQFRSAKRCCGPPAQTTSHLEAQRRAALATRRSRQRWPPAVASILILALGCWPARASSSVRVGAVRTRGVPGLQRCGRIRTVNHRAALRVLVDRSCDLPIATRSASRLKRTIAAVTSRRRNEGAGAGVAHW